MTLRNKKKGQENLHLKSVTMIDQVTGLFKIARYEDKIALLITDLVETI